LEKQSTNLALYSEQFDNAGWTKYQATITSNNTTSPDGTQNADKFVDNTNNDIHALYQAFSISGDNTISIYVKSAEYTRFAISNLSDGGDVLFNLSTVAIISTSANFKNGKIESVGNGWYRVSATTNGTSGSKAMGYSLVNDSGALSFAGTGSKGVYIWGAQLEVSSYATSLINTTSSSATRVADVAFKTSASALIGTSQGVVFIDFFGRATTTNSRILTITGGAEELLIFMEPTGTGNIGVYGTYTGLNYIDIGGANDKLYKFAYAWKANDYALYVNGSAITLTQSASVYSSLSRIDLNQSQSGAEIGKTVVKNFALFPTRLTNAELASLTTL